MTKYKNKATKLEIKPDLFFSVYLGFFVFFIGVINLILIFLSINVRNIDSLFGLIFFLPPIYFIIVGLDCAQRKYFFSNGEIKRRVLYFFSRTYRFKGKIVIQVGKNNNIELYEVFGNLEPMREILVIPKLANKTKTQSIVSEIESFLTCSSVDG